MIRIKEFEAIETEIKLNMKVNNEKESKKRLDRSTS